MVYSSSRGIIVENSEDAKVDAQTSVIISAYDKQHSSAEFGIGSLSYLIYSLASGCLDIISACIMLNPPSTRPSKLFGIHLNRAILILPPSRVYFLQYFNIFPSPNLIKHTPGHSRCPLAIAMLFFSWPPWLQQLPSRGQSH